jgi:hypothetical protein
VVAGGAGGGAGVVAGGAGAGTADHEAAGAGAGTADHEAAGAGAGTADHDAAGAGAGTTAQVDGLAGAGAGTTDHDGAAVVGLTGTSLLIIRQQNVRMSRSMNVIDGNKTASLFRHRRYIVCNTRLWRDKPRSCAPPLGGRLDRRRNHTPALA